MNVLVYKGSYKSAPDESILHYCYISTTRLPMATKLVSMVT